MSYQVITCPNCQGKGCPTCNQTGKVKVNSSQLQKLKNITQQLETRQISSPLPDGQTVIRHNASALGGQSADPTLIKKNTNLAGIIAFSLLAILAGTASASWYFLKTLKPFFGGLISVLILAGTRLAWTKPFFQPQEPDDFLSAIKKIN